VFLTEFLFYKAQVEELMIRTLKNQGKLIPKTVANHLDKILQATISLNTEKSRNHISDSLSVIIIKVGA